MFASYGYFLSGLDFIHIMFAKRPAGPVTIFRQNLRIFPYGQIRKIACWGQPRTLSLRANLARSIVIYTKAPPIVNRPKGNRHRREKQVVEYL